LRLVVLALATLLLLIQWPLWFGKGSWLRVAELQKQVDAQRAANAQIAARNDALAAEVASLRAGKEAIEERARMQLNMVRSDEVFFQVVTGANAPTVPAVPVDAKKKSPAAP
jgi:cell division protein FtsB